jgi:hypothetical protein
LARFSQRSSRVAVSTPARSAAGDICHIRSARRVAAPGRTHDTGIGGGAFGEEKTMQNGDFRLPEAIVGAILVLALLAAGFVATTASAAPAVDAGGSASARTGSH